MAAIANTINFFFIPFLLLVNVLTDNPVESILNGFAADCVATLSATPFDNT
jgi:hypothetical protein